MFGTSENPQLFDAAFVSSSQLPLNQNTLNNLPLRTSIQALIYTPIIASSILFCFLPVLGSPTSNFHPTIHHGRSVARWPQTLDQPPDYCTFPFEALLPS